MPPYKLTYFPVKALGEPIRLLLSYTGKEFEDVRFKVEDWPTIKKNTPFGKVPILEIDGKIINQSTAICRYLGRQANLAGKNDWEALQIDMVVDTVHDLRTAIGSYWYDDNQTSKEEKKKPLLEETVPFYLEKLEKLVENNSGYFANGTLSWGDIYILGLSDYLSHMVGYDIFEKPNLKAWKKKISEMPRIKEWIAKRPQSDL